VVRIFVAGEPGHASSQGAAFYAQDFTRDSGVRIVRRPCHSAKHKHGHRYTKHNDKHDDEYTPGHNQHAAWNDLNPDRNDLNHAVRVNGNTADFSARNHFHRHSRGNTGNARSSGKRGIRNWRNPRQHPDSDWHFDDCRAVHAVQQHQHWNLNNNQQHTFDG
jgi:hypothetical protein